MDRTEAITRLDMITQLMQANIVLLDRIVKALPPSEKFLDDQLCNVIGAYMAVHNTLQMTLRAVKDPTVGQYPSVIDMFEKSVGVRPSHGFRVIEGGDSGGAA